jgi:hypothetical protein
MLSRPVPTDRSALADITTDVGHIDGSRRAGDGGVGVRGSCTASATHRSGYRAPRERAKSVMMSRVTVRAGPPASDDEIREAEQRLGLVTHLPADFRAWLKRSNGVEGWYGPVYLVLYSLDNVISVTQAADAGERLPGFLAVGSDGGGELIAYDLRKSAPPIVMVNSVSAGWHEGLYQAASFSEFLAQRQAGEPLDWHREYR